MPCRTCTACCTSSQFLTVAPTRTETRPLGSSGAGFALGPLGVVNGGVFPCALPDVPLWERRGLLPVLIGLTLDHPGAARLQQVLEADEEVSYALLASRLDPPRHLGDTN